MESIAKFVSSEIAILVENITQPMKTSKLPLLIVGLFLSISPLFGQQTHYYTDIHQEIAVGKELFGKAKYNAAFRQFEQIAGKLDEKSELYSEAVYYQALSALRVGHSSGEKMLTSFTKEYPESPYSNYARFYLGDYQFDKKRYPVVVRTLEEVDRFELSDQDRIKCGYEMGYSHLMMDELDKAANEFFQIKDKNDLYSKPATYYWAHINYLKGNYETALESFRKLEGDPNFSKVIPMYVSQIYYKQEKYDQVVNYTGVIINEVEESYKPELAKILGDSYFHLRRFADAIQFLEYYHQVEKVTSREDNYLLGYCYFYTQQFGKAIPYLEKSSKGNDLLAQNAYYHLADSYIRTNQKEKARVAFAAASEMEFDERIKEDALFNYAKLTYELSYSPFNETIKAFDKYISLYPNSERNSAAYQYLVEVFMVTRNYRDAIAAIEKIKVKNTAINQAYQRVTYYRGLELFGNQAYEQAVEHFDKSLAYRSLNRQLEAGALFWRSEALYRLGDYNAAINGFNQFMKTAGAFSMPEYNEANYSLGYAYFKLEDYSQASSFFRKYLNAVQGKRSEKVADAYNRLGDTYFQVRDYSEAVKNYQQSLSMKLYDADYALYQLALCSGLQRNQEAKINQLRSLISGYSQSAYLDDAYFELGRTYERSGQYAEAKREYLNITERFKQSTFYPKALLQLGLVSYNTTDYNSSLRYYKEVTEKFAGTPEAQAALLGIKNCYVEMNDVDSYFAYAQKLGTGVSVTVSEQDSLSYQAAERQFMANDPNAVNQLRRYLQQFPNGSFRLNANFYLGEALYRDGKYSESLEYYLFVSRQPLNIFSEPALSKASELLFNAKKFDEALELFERLETVSGNKWNTSKALAGKMRCSFYLERYRNAIEAAGKLMEAEKTNEALQREARYITGKSYYNLGNLDQALPGLKETAAETNSVQGAEAKYLVAEIYFKKQNANAAEKEILDFISKGTPHTFWLAKSFILLSDVYLAKNDEFQAKHTLKSLVENYNVDNDGIIDEASRKLSEIESREKREQEAVKSNPMQINLNQK